MNTSCVHIKPPYTVKELGSSSEVNVFRADVRAMQFIESRLNNALQCPAIFFKLKGLPSSLTKKDCTIIPLPLILLSICSIREVGFLPTRVKYLLHGPAKGKARNESPCPYGRGIPAEKEIWEASLYPRNQWDVPRLAVAGLIISQWPPLLLPALLRTPLLFNLLTYSITVFLLMDRFVAIFSKVI